MKSILVIASAWLAFFLFVCPPAPAADPPFLTIEDEGGERFPPEPVDDNSTVFTIIPGARCVFEVEGTPGTVYVVLVSYNTTGAPTGQFVATPYYHLRPGAATYRLNAQGLARISAAVPRNFGPDATLYVQGVLSGPPNLWTNGITFEVAAPSVNADIAVHRGPPAGSGLNQITQVGRLMDNMAEDNQVSGDGLVNGESIVIVPELAGHVIAYADDGAPAGAYPRPANSLYLNGHSYIVPGNAGIGSGFKYSWTGVTPTRTYPAKGSQMGIYRRESVCRNFENAAVQHIVIPPIAGGAEQDLNLYHVRNRSGNAYGFMTLDVETNEFNVLTDTFLVVDPDNDPEHVSPWDCNVAISPDRKLMAAVRKTGNDQLYIIHLDGSGMQQITVGDGAAAPENIYAETTVFLRTDDPDAFALVFATGFTNSVNPPSDSISDLWTYITTDESNTAIHFIPGEDIPATGTSYSPVFIGKGFKYSGANSPRLNNAEWLRSGDERTLFLRIAGRYYEVGETPGDWTWDVYAITDVLASGAASIVNVSRFSQGKIIAPLGRCYNGTATAATNYDGSRLAFMTADTVGTHELYFYATDGSDWTEKDLMNRGDFNWTDKNGYTFIACDPYVADKDHVLFFYGAVRNSTGVRKMDLFLFNESTSTMTNLTKTGTATPPFKDHGFVSTGGYFVSDDGRYLYFLRGNDSVSTGIKNLVGIDLQDDFSIFSLTGNEYGSPLVGDVCQRVGNEGEAMNLFLSPSGLVDFLYFTAKLQSATQQSHQVFLLDLVNPFSAFQITSFPDNQIGIIDNLVASENNMMLAFSRSNRSDFPDQTEKIFVVDLNAYGYTRDLMEGLNYEYAAVDGSLHFIPGDTSPPDPRGPQLVYAFGSGTDGADNPFPARAWAFPLINVSNSSVPSVSYPLTATGSIFIYNAIK